MNKSAQTTKTAPKQLKIKSSNAGSESTQLPCAVVLW